MKELAVAGYWAVDAYGGHVDGYWAVDGYRGLVVAGYGAAWPAIGPVAGYRAVAS